MNKDFLGKNIDGFFGFAELYDKVAARLYDGFHAVEIGAYKGRSTSYLAELILKSNKKIIFDVIDTWNGSREHKKIYYFDIFKKNLTSIGLFNLINPIRLDSISAAKRYSEDSLDFVMIDASHDKESVVKDIVAWLPKVKYGGILAGDDYDFDGVSAAINALNLTVTIYPRTVGKDCVKDIDAGNFWYFIK